MANPPQIISTVFEITSSGTSDTDNLYVRVEISKGSTALSGKTEQEVLGAVKAYLQSISANPITASRTQTIRIDGL